MKGQIHGFLRPRRSQPVPAQQDGHVGMAIVMGPDQQLGLISERLQE